MNKAKKMKKIFLDPDLEPQEIADRILGDILQQEFTPELYLRALDSLRNEEVVSTAILQRKLQIPYYLARIILDKMIAENFCDKKQGAAPCKIIRLIN